MTVVEQLAGEVERLREEDEELREELADERDRTARELARVRSRVTELEDSDESDPVKPDSDDSTL